MKESYLFDMTLNNIVFEGRNKAYGAYKLRSIYHRHITIAAIVAVATFSAGLVGPLVNSMVAGEKEKYVKPTLTIKDPVVIYLPPPPVAPQPEKAPALPATPEKVKIATEVYADTKVVRDKDVVKEVELANQEDLKNANFGTAKEEGIKPDNLNTTLPEDALNGIDGGTGETAPADEALIYADVMPQFEGGMDDLMKYLQRKMRYPGAAQSAGIEGTVVVTFIVDRTGKVSNVQVLKGLGFGTDEEAMRVVKGMPDWTPGQQNGRPVAVRYTLPIKFSLKK
ncbi:energy transducer TonB [Pontibacter sp. Tf4]|uniref:energy transducer TonB n=1 Tax=Pontibacter sp. Tf4 TaxID=2761620 RepID=UPI001629C573|nr:energy transducer TonB [Pontibacter sp. Tf4]MBB6612923.1 energy transducer TonB [Pontibacter sp. Tf4]